jgi:hypothetical protein
VLRLQSEIQDIQEKAIQAVHVVQLLDNKDPPDPQSGGGLSKRSSAKTLSTRSLPLESPSPRSPRHSHPAHALGQGQRAGSARALVNQHDYSLDGEVTVELSLEPDDDEEEDHGHDNGNIMDQRRREAEEKLTDTEEVYTEAEVDLMLQQSLVNLKLEEKSVASLSPVVEDRLLRNIYQKYALETTGYLTLSRFLPPLPWLD